MTSFISRLLSSTEPEYVNLLPDFTERALTVEQPGAIPMALNAASNLDATLADRQARLERELATIAEDLRQVRYTREGLAPFIHHLARDRTATQEQQ
jgi:hypothetical protein